jgi:catechol 2,3-dioxygenase-like lactoylglutathione lyase family enzyme
MIEDIPLVGVFVNDQEAALDFYTDKLRDYLVEELRALGIDVEVQEGIGARTFRADTVAGRVENVVATIQGRDPTGRVVLAAHYDTTLGSPGASDDKAAVAAILETARALTSGGGSATTWYSSLRTGRSRGCSAPRLSWTNILTGTTVAWCSTGRPPATPALRCCSRPRQATRP